MRNILVNNACCSRIMGQYAVIIVDADTRFYPASGDDADLNENVSDMSNHSTGTVDRGLSVIRQWKDIVTWEILSRWLSAAGLPRYLPGR